MTKKKPVRMVKKDPQKLEPMVVETKKPEPQPEVPKPEVVEQEKVESPKPDDEKSLFDQMPDVVEDPINVFKLAMLDAQHQAALLKRDKDNLEIQTQLRNIQIRQNQLVQENNAAIKKTEMMIKQQCDYLEEKHGLVLKYYTHNDVTGVLTKDSKGPGE